MTRRHKKAAALADAMKAEDEAEKQRLLIEEDTTKDKRDTLAEMRDIIIADIDTAAAEMKDKIRRQYAQLIADEEKRIAQIERQLRDLEDEPGIGHNSREAA